MKDLLGVINRYLTKATQYAIQITGPWGSGKTFCYFNTILPSIVNRKTYSGGIRPERVKHPDLGGSMKFFVLMATLMLTLVAEARIQVLLHPHDPTLEAIAGCISDAKSTVDIAMYNMDITDQSPIIQTLKYPEVQKRIQSGDLRIRMVLELYAT